MNRSKRFYQHGEYREAIETIKAMLKLTKRALCLMETLLNYKLIAMINFNRKDYETALNICHIVIQECSLKPQLQDMRLAMLKLAGLCRMRLSQFPEALQAWKLCYEQALRMSDDTAEVYCYE